MPTHREKRGQRWFLIFDAQSTTKGHNRGKQKKRARGRRGGDTEKETERRTRKDMERKTESYRQREMERLKQKSIHELWRTKRPCCDTHSRTLDELEPEELVLGSTYHDDVSAYRLHGVAIQYHRLQWGDSTQWVRQPVRHHVCKKLHMSFGIWVLEFS